MNPRPAPRVKWSLFLPSIIFLTIAPLSASPPDCPDADGDGWVVCDGECAPAGGDQCGDCDDASAARFPGNAEICDGLDNDCNGSADETFGLGEACTTGLGVCQAAGVTACTSRGVGTTLLKDIRPGPESSDPEYFTNVNGIVFFYADDGVNGSELWKSDGTEAGTVMVKDINPGPDGSFPGNPIDTLRNVDGTLFYYADDGVNGAELWKSDGTEQGTVMVKDINPGPDGSRHGSVEHGGGAFVVFNGALFFWADDGVIGSELWTSDGTEAGTVLVKDINPAPPGSVWVEFVARIIDGVLYFGARDDDHGVELWRTDGTAAGTVLVKDIFPGSSSSLDDADQWANLDGTLYLGAAGSTGIMVEPWRSDGTEQGTELIKDLDTWPTAGSFPAEFVTLNDAVLFGALAGCPTLWKTDGTAEGTVVVRDINPDCASYVDNIVNALGAVFFQAFHNDSGLELWRSDGTFQGTVLVKDIYPGSESSWPFYVTEMNGTLFFSASDGTGGGTFWKTDGTQEGTVLMHPDLSAGEMINADGTLFLRGFDVEFDSELWISDGTLDGTRCDAVIGPSSAEVCGDFLDNDCDGSVDEGDALDASMWYMDSDGDTFGDPERPTTACTQLAGWVTDTSDCADDDDQAWEFPSEAGNLRFLADKMTLSWDAATTFDASSVVYDTIRSEDPDEFFSPTTCIEESDGSDTVAIDAEVPPAGVVYHYLVGAQNSCGVVFLDPDRDARPCPWDD